MDILINVSNPALRTIIEDAIAKVNLWSDIVYFPEKDAIYDLSFSDKFGSAIALSKKHIEFSDKAYATNMNINFAGAVNLFEEDKYHFFVKLLEHTFKIKNMHKPEQMNFLI